MLADDSLMPKQRPADDGFSISGKSLRRTMFLLGSAFGSLVSFINAVLDWHSGLTASIPQDLMLGAVLIPLFIWAWRQDDPTTPARIGMLLFCISFIPSIPDELRRMPIFLLWLPVIPMLAFYFFGFREGVIWAIGFAMLVSLEVLWLLSHGAAPYSTPMLIPAGIIYLFICGAVAAFQYLIEAYEKQRIHDAMIREQVHRQMTEIQQLETIGVLAGGIAHDFNNLLVGVMGNAELAMLDTPKQSLIHPYLEQIFKSARRGADLVSQLLAYSGQGNIAIARINLNRLADEVSNLLATLITQRATLHSNLTPDLPDIEGDHNQISQVIMNLLTNAAEAIPQKQGEIHLSSGVQELKQSDLRGMFAGKETAPGQFAFLRVEDNGSGMDEAIQNRIFDPFFTTKEAGTGLGLAALQGIVRIHHGALHLHSEPGRGSTFTVYFPVAANPASRT